jgi:hypothetical protein
LNEIYIPNSGIKFYTSPDDIMYYRSEYPSNNFSFTPTHANDLYNENNQRQGSHEKNFNWNNTLNVKSGFSQFPIIPDSYKNNKIALDENIIYNKYINKIKEEYIC